MYAFRNFSDARRSANANTRSAILFRSERKRRKNINAMER
jgi:hypothetical protein